MFKFFKKKNKESSEIKKENGIKDVFDKLEDKFEQNKDTETKIDDLINKIQPELTESEEVLDNEKQALIEPSPFEVFENIETKENIQNKKSEEHLEEVVKDEKSEKHLEEVLKDEESEEQLEEVIPVAKKKKILDIFPTKKKKKKKLLKENPADVQNIIGATLSQTELREVNTHQYISRHSNHIISQINSKLLDLFNDQNINCLLYTSPSPRDRG